MSDEMTPEERQKLEQQMADRMAKLERAKQKLEQLKEQDKERLEEVEMWLQQMGQPELVSWVKADLPEQPTLLEKLWKAVSKARLNLKVVNHDTIRKQDILDSVVDAVEAATYELAVRRAQA